MAHWVQKSARSLSGEASVLVRPIGEDPEALRLLDPGLNIWDAYATSHLIMPDGTTKLGGEAVAEILRNSPNCRWFASSFAFSILGFRPFQTLLDLGYAILSDVRPLFGCESCGTPRFWVKPIHSALAGMRAVFGRQPSPALSPHFTALAPAAHRPQILAEHSPLLRK